MTAEQTAAAASSSTPPTDQHLSAILPVGRRVLASVGQARVVWLSALGNGQEPSAVVGPRPAASRRTLDQCSFFGTSPSIVHRRQCWRCSFKVLSSLAFLACTRTFGLLSVRQYACEGAYHAIMRCGCSFSTSARPLAASRNRKFLLLLRPSPHSFLGRSLEGLRFRLGSKSTVLGLFLPFAESIREHAEDVDQARRKRRAESVTYAELKTYDDYRRGASRTYSV